MAKLGNKSMLMALAASITKTPNRPSSLAVISVSELPMPPKVAKFGERVRWGGTVTDWQQVNSDGFGGASNTDLSLAVFPNQIYAGTENEETGGEIWRSPTGTTREQMNADGFCDINNEGISTHTDSYKLEPPLLITSLEMPSTIGIQV